MTEIEIVLVGVVFAGGVTVTPGDPIPMARLVAHNAAMMPELMLIGFMVSTSRWCELGDYFWFADRLYSVSIVSIFR